MNIFVLDIDPYKAAQYHHDRHVLKMILESAQLLSSAWHVLNPGRTDIYKPTHLNHPCAKWVRDCSLNYDYLGSLAYGLCLEYTHRYGKIHKTQAIIELLRKWPPNITITEPQGFVQVMPDQYQRSNAVDAYRAYYRAEKVATAKWTNRDRPLWLSPTEPHTPS